jgi:hypothetical protein
MYALADLLYHLGKSASHCRRQIDHLYPFWFKADTAQLGLDLVNTPPGVEIAILEVAITFQTTSDEDSIRPMLKGVQNLEHIQASSARNLDDPGLGGVLQAQHSGKIGRRIRTIMTAVSHNS